MGVLKQKVKQHNTVSQMRRVRRENYGRHSLKLLSLENSASSIRCFTKLKNWKLSKKMIIKIAITSGILNHRVSLYSFRSLKTSKQVVESMYNKALIGITAESVEIISLPSKCQNVWYGTKSGMQLCPLLGKVMHDEAHQDPPNYCNSTINSKRKSEVIQAQIFMIDSQEHF